MVDICYYSSDFYAPYTGISMYSLCKNNEDLDFRLNCIDTGISEENKAKMMQVARQFNKKIVFHDYHVLEAFIRDELKLPICSGSYATYIKVFPDKLFKNTDRILFVDGDTIIDGSIRGLLETDITDYVFAAAKVPLINEARVYKENAPNNIRLEYANKFTETGYYNIGIFYCNLKRWEEENFGEKILATREEHLPRMTQAKDVPIDEMMVNLAVLENPDKCYAKELPAIYNATSHNIPHHRSKKTALMCGYIEEKDFEKAYYNPVIIHYCIFKPWYTDTYTRFKGKVKQYKKESPWPDAFEEKLYKKPAEKWFGRFVHLMPTEWLMLLMIQFGHLFLRIRSRLKSFFTYDQSKYISFSAGAKRLGRAISNSYLAAAFRRRWTRLVQRDYRTAFAFPKKIFKFRKR